MTQATDVFVVGGGPAGLAVAIAARQRGFHVTVADGGRPPLDKACGEGLLPEAVAALRRLGISLGPEDGQALSGIRFLEGDGAAEASFAEGRGAGVRRTRLHQRMVKRAEEAGVALRWNSPVTGLDRRGVYSGGHFVRARWIVGADGTSSRVRKWSGLDRVKRHTRRFAYTAHFRVAAWTEFTEVYWAGGIQAYVTPLDAETVGVALIAAQPGIKVQPALGRFPALKERLANAALLGPERGAGTSMLKLAAVSSRPVALAGDASGGIDAITGQGLCCAFLQAEALAAALASDNLALYETTHRKISRRPWLMAKLLLLLSGHPSLRSRTMRVLRTHPELFADLLAAHTGAASPGGAAIAGTLLGWRMLAA